METLISWLAWLPKQLIVAIIAAFPIIELRGAIPVGILALGLPTWEVFLFAMIGNLLPIPLILWLLPPVRRMGMGWPLVGPVLRWAEARAVKRQASIEKYGFWGLVTFVGVPLPGTGAWTGALIAVLLGMPRGLSLAAISLGVLVAGVLIAILSAAGLMALS